jgi:hypothetical protein
VMNTRSGSQANHRGDPSRSRFFSPTRIQEFIAIHSLHRYLLERWRSGSHSSVGSSDGSFDEA